MRVDKFSVSFYEMNDIEVGQRQRPEFLLYFGVAKKRRARLQAAGSTTKGRRLGGAGHADRC